MSKKRIMVIAPGGMKGKTSGDFIEEPTEAELKLAEANPRGARILEETPSGGRSKPRTIGKGNENEEVTG